jgi:hypothetical protein
MATQINCKDNACGYTTDIELSSKTNPTRCPKCGEELLISCIGDPLYVEGKLNPILFDNEEPSEEDKIVLYAIKESQQTNSIVKLPYTQELENVLSLESKDYQWGDGIEEGSSIGDFWGEDENGSWRIHLQKEPEET